MNNPAHRVPASVWIGLSLAIALDTLVQIVWKSAVLRVPKDVGTIQLFAQIAAHPAVWIILGLFALQFLNWMFVLSRADLSYAQPLTGLSYVTVCVTSAIVYSEHLPVARLAGIGLILVGVWLVSGSGHRTQIPSLVHASQIDLAKDLANDRIEERA